MKRIVVLSGAGMSAESGISTFRDSGGLWEQHRIEDVATPEAFQRNPELVLDFYNQRRKQLFDVKPNDGHLILAELENTLEVQIITQNVDNLHERAGSKNVLHLHGELMKVRSTGSGGEIFELSQEKPEIHIGDKCPKGYQLRPHIVWFGEAVPEIENAIKITQTADMLVIIGTSLQVYPAAGLINYAPDETPVYVIDPNEISINNQHIVHIKKGAGEGMRELKEKIEI
ncbi:MAG: NAD-dependent deacylase [Paludibacteraceae bacterium]